MCRKAQECVRACVCACVRACVCVCVCVYRGYEREINLLSLYLFPSGWPRDACAYLDTIKSLLRRGGAFTHTRSLIVTDPQQTGRASRWHTSFFCYRSDNDIRGVTFSLLFTLVFLYPTLLSNSGRLGRR